MKALIVSFFGVILGYSLFIDTDKEPKLPIDHQETAVPSQIAAHKQTADSIDYYSNKTRRYQMDAFQLYPF